MKKLLISLYVAVTSLLTTSIAHAQISTRTGIIPQIIGEYQTAGSQVAIVMTFIFGLAAFGALMMLIYKAFFQRAEPAEWFKYGVLAVLGTIAGLISFFFTGVTV